MATRIKIGSNFSLTIDETDITFKQIVKSFSKYQNKKDNFWTVSAKNILFSLPKEIIDNNFVLIYTEHD
jgi:hypothetical protein